MGGSEVASSGAPLEYNGQEKEPKRVWRADRSLAEGDDWSSTVSLLTGLGLERPHEGVSM